MAEGQTARWRNRRQAKAAGMPKSDSGKPEMDAIAERDYTTSADSGENRPPLPEDSRVRIGQNLRALYNQVIEQPVPENLLRLLRDLADRESGGKGGEGQY